MRPRSRTGAGAAVELSDAAAKKQPPRKTSRAHVVEPGVREADQAADAGAGAAPADHLVDEDVAGRVDRGELKLDLGAEVGEQAALADAEIRCEPADREALEPLLGGDLDRAGKNRVPGLLTPGPAAVDRRRLDLNARRAFRASRA